MGRWRGARWVRSARSAALRSRGALRIANDAIGMLVRGKGNGMAERQGKALERAKSDTDADIRQLAGRFPAEQIADA